METGPCKNADATICNFPFLIHGTHGSLIPSVQFEVTFHPQFTFRHLTILVIIFI